MKKQKYITCRQLADTFGVSSKTMQSWIREFDIPYFNDGEQYILPPNGLELLEPHIFITHQQRQDRAEARKNTRLSVKSMKARSNAAKKAWETRRKNATKAERNNAWNTYGYELYRAGM